jgi:hypothetical protein
VDKLRRCEGWLRALRTHTSMRVLSILCVCCRYYPHGVGALMQHICKVAGSSQRTLLEPMRSEFVQLHRDYTDNWGLVVAISQQEHRELTQKRKRDLGTTVY